MRSYNEITYRYLKGQKKRTLLTIIGIILSVALITSIGTMVVSAREMMIKNEIKSNGDYHAIFLDISRDKIGNIKNYVGVDSSGVISKIGTAILAEISQDERQQSPEAPPYRYLDIRGYDKAAFDILPITLKEGRLPKNEGEIVLEYWVPDYMPSSPKIGDVITLPIGIRLDEEGNELPPNTWSDKETFEERDVRKYTIVGFSQPRLAWVGQYMTKGITFIDSNSLLSDDSYNVYVKMDSVRGVHKRTEEMAQALDLPQSIGDDGQPGYGIEYNKASKAMPKV